jgi:DNA-binding response OmpR family regulator
MKVMLTSRDRDFCNRARSAFAREGSAVRIVDRLGIWSQETADDDVMILHAGNTGSAARWCRVARRVRRTGPLIACCDTVDPAGVAAVLDAGADDVVASSTADAELLARVRAVCRRAQAMNPTQRRWGAIVVDLPTRVVSIRGVPVTLRRAEFRLLSYLLSNADRVVGARELIEDVLGGTHSDGTALVRVHLSQLRRKLGAAGAAIETVRGQGYRLIRTDSPDDDPLRQSA